MISSPTVSDGFVAVQRELHLHLQDPGTAIPKPIITTDRTEEDVKITGTGPVNFDVVLDERNFA